MTQSEAFAGSDPARRSRSVLAAGIVATLALASAGFALGRDASSLKPKPRVGQAWLATTGHGSVSQVDGLSGAAGAEVFVNGAAGHQLAVTQSGDTVVVRDTVSGAITVIDTLQLTTGAHVDRGPGVTVLTGAGSTYLVDRDAGTVQRVDTATLADLAPAVQLPGRLGLPVVDGAGTLWTPVDTDGTVVPVLDGTAGAAIPVAGSGSDLVMALAGGTPVAVDRTAGKVTTLSRSGRGQVINLPGSAGAGTNLRVADAAGDLPLPLVQTGPVAQLVLVDVTARAPVEVALPARAADHDLQSPVQAGTRTFIADFDTGAVLVYDRAAKRWWDSDIRVLDRPGGFETKVVDGIVYFNDPATGDAVSVTPDGVRHQISKTGPSVPTSAPATSTSTTSTQRSVGNQATSPTGPSSSPSNTVPKPTTTPPPSHPSTSVGIPTLPVNVPRPSPSTTTGSPPPIPITTSRPSPVPTPSPTSISSAPTPKPTTSSSSATPKPSTTTSSSSPPPPVAPPAPQGLTATATGQGTVQIGWQAFPNPGAVKSVTVTVSPAGGTQTNPTTTGVTITGLQCQSYTFTAVANGSNGLNSAPSQPASAIACLTPSAPGAPAIGTSPDPKTLPVSWAPVAGAASYDVSLTMRTEPNSPGAVAVPGQTGLTGTSATFGNLLMGQVYIAQVTARNAAGSAASPTVSGISGEGSKQIVYVDMSNFQRVRACDPSATSGPTQCEAWLQQSPTSWTGSYPSAVVSYEPQGAALSVYCGKQGATVTNDHGGSAATWLLTNGNTYNAWLNIEWDRGAVGSGLPTCNF